MSQVSVYSTLLNTALEANVIDTTRLSEVKDDLDILTALKTWAPLKATIASVAAKIINPDWDTRLHQSQIGGVHSLRSIDTSCIAPFLYEKGLYDTVTTFALTRSFEKPEAFNKTYSGNITPKESKSSFLNVVELINTSTDPELLHDILAHLLSFLKDRKMAVTALKQSVVASSKELDMLDVSTMLDQINTLGPGSSVVPVIIARTLLYVIQPYLWPGISISPLKQHNAADNHSKSFGDIEGLDSSSNPKIAIEVKHKLVIDNSIIMIFDSKTRDANIPLKCILTTAKTEKKVSQNNICIDTINGFVVSHLQQALFHEETVCLKFVHELRTQIVSYTNLGVAIKQTINEIITSLLVPPSP
jgi:hypothetical protein